MKWWHFLIAGFAYIIAFMGLTELIGWEMAVIYILAFSFSGLSAYFLYYFLYKVKKQSKFFRGGISPETTKYIIAKHLLEHHRVNVFAKDAGVADPTRTKYIVPLLARRMYPSSNEEAWIVRCRIKDPRYFAGQDTKIIIYLDGGGMVMNDDCIMNTSTFIDEDYWRHPEKFFTQGVSKTREQPSLKDILAHKIQEEGKLPADLGAEILRSETGLSEPKPEQPT